MNGSMLSFDSTIKASRPKAAIPISAFFPNRYREESICIFIPFENENYCSHQSLNWWQEHATGMFHL